ncbi:MAG: acyl-CoA thioester hydrolase [Deltaproteobacteria bacterium RIFCSPLOWO2_02_FULL_50_16]|nr:MAG: acyl-CoA thioester hydrolase [Deltaproteobacteria bacterium RIFCSPHIGHO2_02_FULL_50_15]OGQ57159.1 MAG: acyl-CoA thioester hydrolase [Deltaproteobacteria bacterium RIFCSPLOWO2_02_FULL_50_16]OGQ69124.1 MAG: acyl-CoA thioester hydrolase [Deltaproteobacteria bacterium RIFCSPLOWO2_12_FULL_50_11]
MKPKPPIFEKYNDKDYYVKDKTTGLVWHRCGHRTLYADTDRSEVVYHANYFRYFELGRTTLMRDIAHPYREIERSGYVYPVIELGIDFYSPLYYDDPFWIHTRLLKLERVKLRFDYMITHGETGKIVCTGFTRHCAINTSGIPVAIDEKTVQLWKTFPK